MKRAFLQFCGVLDCLLSIPLVILGFIVGFVWLSILLGIGLYEDVLEQLDQALKEDE